MITLQREELIETIHMARADDLEVAAINRQERTTLMRSACATT